MSSRDVSEAQQLAKRFLDGQGSSSSGEPSKVAPNMPTVTGTGFFISEDGYLLTNYHVVGGASKIAVRTANDELRASVISADSSNDLALLKVSGKFTALPLGNVHDAGLGDSVMTIGFPNIQVQGLSPKLTRGEISSLSGAQDDPRVFQISVPVQPGNSGGALIDRFGNVIGVTTAQLDALTALKISGSLPQNVNYAIKISYARLLVDAVPGLSDKLARPQTEKPDAKGITDRATRATVLIFGWVKR
jgi:serine protease Do